MTKAYNKTFLIKIIYIFCYNSVFLNNYSKLEKEDIY